MFYLKIFICIMSFLLISCSPTIQNNGLPEVKFNKIKIEIGKTSKKDLIRKYGPPIFQSVFNDNIIYYVSHKTSYKLLDKLKTEKLLIYEVYLDKKNIVENFQKYSEKDAFNIEISNKETGDDKDAVFILKEILNNMRRKNVQN
ncbi:MAG: hypothetical protein ACJ0BR_05875 [Candidatus Puniceispirillales bacterium]